MGSTQQSWWICTIAIALTGCGAELATVTPEVLLPKSFSRSGREALPEKWWQVLANPELDSLIEEALGNNPTIRSAWDRLYQAEQEAVKAGAALQPSVDASGNFKRSRMDEDGSITQKNDLTIGLATSFEIDLWGRIDAIREASLLSIEARREDLATAAITLSATVAMTWFHLAEQRQQAVILTRQIETNEAMLEVIELKFQKGAVGAPDVLRQRELLESARGRLVQANETIVLLQYQLSVLLGRPPEASWAATMPCLPELGEMPEILVPSELLQRRPDVVRAYKTVQKVDRQVAAAVAEQYPSVSLYASTSATSTHIEDLFDNWAASLAGSLLAPLFDGGVRKAEANRVRGELSEAIHAYTQAVLNALKEVEDAINREVSQRDYLLHISRQQKLAGEFHQSISLQYVNGQTDYLSVLEALESQQVLELDVVVARFELVTRRIDLCRAIAGPWQMTRPILADTSE